MILAVFQLIYRVMTGNPRKRQTDSANYKFTADSSNVGLYGILYNSKYSIAYRVAGACN
jgi:hypothetical protein